MISGNYGFGFGVGVVGGGSFAMGGLSQSFGGFSAMGQQLFNLGGGGYGCFPSFQAPPQFGNACCGYMGQSPQFGNCGFGPFPGGGFGGNYGGGFVAGQVEFGQLQLPGETNKMWDVWFDSKDGQKTVQRSPIVLDLNKNGQADITGKNILGDGKVDGPTTMFDLDPDSISYEFKSQQRRPGSGAPAVKGGYWVNDKGERVKNGPPKGTQKKFEGYKYMDAKGNLVGEMKNDGLYHYGKQEKREQTEWLKKNGGDGFLVADYNGDGQINDATELFGTEGKNGKKYANGYEKLAALHDKNRDGKISGAELAGLQVWKDTNADGKVQKGELQTLQQHGITSFDVSNYNAKTMEGSFGTNEKTIPYMNMSLVGGSFGGGWGGGFGGNYGGGGGSQFFGGGNMFAMNATVFGNYY